MKDLVELPYLTEEKPSLKEYDRSPIRERTLDSLSFQSSIIICFNMLISHVILKNLAALDTELKTKPYLFTPQSQWEWEGKLYYLKLLNKDKTRTSNYSSRQVNI